MKIQVTRGEVPIRSVIVRAHPHVHGRIFTVIISTPLDKNPIVTMEQVISPGDGLSQKVELFRARREASEFNPSVVTLSPSTASEELAFDAGLIEVPEGRWAVTVLAIAPEILATGHVVESWEQFARGQADYIDGV